MTDGLKGGVQQFDDSVAIGRSNALITPYQSFDGARASDNTAFLATYDATVAGFPALANWSILIRSWRKLYWLKMEMAHTNDIP